MDLLGNEGHHHPEGFLVFAEPHAVVLELEHALQLLVLHLEPRHALILVYLDLEFALLVYH